MKWKKTMFPNSTSGVQAEPRSPSSWRLAAQQRAAWLAGAAYRVLARDILALVFFTIVSLAAMYPVILHPRSQIIGPPGDNIQYTYMTGWVGQSLLLHRSPLVDPRLNYPDDLALPATDAPFLSMLAVAPATWVLGPVFGYNAIVFLSFVLSGYFTYLWILNLTGSRAGGLVAGLGFLLMPYHYVQSYGHLQLISTQMLPLFFWALDRVLRADPPSQRELRLLGGATFLVGCMSQYYLVIALVTGGIYTLLMLLPRLSYVVRNGWPIMVQIFFGSLLGMLPYLTILNAGVFEPYNIGATRVWSAEPLNFVLPATYHRLWGSIIAQINPDSRLIEKSLYVGVVTAGLALLALLWPKSPYRSRTLVWGGVALLAAIFALGPDLHWRGEPLSEHSPFWLPAYYLGNLPLINIMRVWSRFGVITLLFVMGLAGIATAQLAQRLGRRTGPMLLLLLLLIVVDFLPAQPLIIPLGPRPIDLWLARQPGDFAVAFLPPDNDVATYQAMFGSLFHSKQMPAFNHPNHQPRSYRDFARLAADFPSLHSVGELRRLGYRYLVLDRALYSGWRAAYWRDVEAGIAHAPNLQVVDEIEGFVIVTFK
jgi:hypothetical protein